MKRLKNSNIAPVGGWRFKDPETNHEFKEPSLEELVKRVRRYRAANKLDPIRGLSTLVEAWICENSKSPCVDIPRSRSIKEYWQGAKAAVKIKTSKDPYVSNEIATARAETCIRCPHNQINNNHSSLGQYSDRYVQSLVGNRKTKYDNQIYTCEVCSCSLRSKVHISQKIVENSLSAATKIRFPNGTPGRDRKPLFCWQINPIKETDADN